jgi:hypothetical protein
LTDYCESESWTFILHVLSENMIPSSQPSDTDIRRDGPPSSRSGAASVDVSGIISRFWTAILDRVPVGYEDETGFHFGAQLPRRNTEAGVLTDKQTDQPPEGICS